MKGLQVENVNSQRLASSCQSREGNWFVCINKWRKCQRLAGGQGVIHDGRSSSVLNIKLVAASRQLRSQFLENDSHELGWRRQWSSRGVEEKRVCNNAASGAGARESRGIDPAVRGERRRLYAVTERGQGLDSELQKFKRARERALRTLETGLTLSNADIALTLVSNAALWQEEGLFGTH